MSEVWKVKKRVALRLRFLLGAAGLSSALGVFLRFQILNLYLRFLRRRCWFCIHDIDPSNICNATPRSGGVSRKARAQYLEITHQEISERLAPLRSNSASR